MRITFLEIFTLVAIFHCFLLSLILLGSKFLRSETNKYLGYTLFIITVIGLNNWFWDLDKDPIIIRFFDLFLWQFLYPVTLLVYFAKATKNAFKTTTIQRLLIPFVFFSVLNIWVTLDNIYNLIHLPFLTAKSIAGFYKLISALSIIFPLLFLGLSYKFLFGKSKNININWLKVFWGLFLLIEVYGVVLEFHRFLYVERKPLTYLWTALSLVLYWLMYIGIYRFKLSNDQFEIRHFINTKPQKSKTKNKANENAYIEQLRVLILNENIHHDPFLNRDVVADKLGISSGYLSQLVGATDFQNFSNFINHYRVNDVKEMIVNPDFDKYNLLAIGLEVGFNSKATFYNAFKKETGMTPNQFKRQHI